MSFASIYRICLLLFLYSNSIYAQPETINKEVNGVKIKIAVFDYGIGISNANKTEIDTSSPTLNYFEGSKFTIFQKTNKIIAQKGIEFGLNYAVRTSADSGIQ